MDTNGTSARITEQILRLVTTTAKVDSEPTTAASKAAAATPLLMTIPEVAFGLRIGRSTVYELISRGGLEVVHIGRATRIPVQAVDDLVQRLRQAEASSSHPGTTAS
jgi:excisionase family DNA binding protein